MIIFSQHALDQMKRRGISRQEVLEVIHNTSVKKSSYRGRKLLRMKRNDKILEVVTKQEGIKTIVITAYYIKEE